MVNDMKSISQSIKYRMPCADDDPRNEYRVISQKLSPDLRGKGFYWLFKSDLPPTISELFLGSLRLMVHETCDLNRIAEAINKVPRYMDARAVALDMTIYLKGTSSNGAPRLQTSFHCFKEWDKDGNEVEIII
ncbi:hypothetical protein GZH47_33415 (plasmid) [Paenibacillus rhizovicinus]|uniref:Uncharacterized protein n=1 Tax=Paenibacillus rhizovicinus TaxID=2704463 RepID=A0A6C0PB42_9BACL|nr:hypothetical protein [Paenibacillus rhizovicinus]QHW35794.1 hypothetical protein GZH47_33415 [Paenibacillus rhizovicinus]